MFSTFAAAFKLNLRMFLAWALLIAVSRTSLGQIPDLPISVGDSGVGYIDTAVVSNQFRLRFDATYDSNKPNRAEYLWAWSPPAGPGPLADESSADYQRIAAYLEYSWDPLYSVFIDAGLVASNPEVNPNSGGLGDIEAGFKVALYSDCDSLATFQLKGYFPSGDADRALGTGHFSLEPGLLFFRRVGDVAFEAEIKDWIPIDGTTNRQGNILRYGVGASADLSSYDMPNVRPVVEVVGWSVLDGMQRFLGPSGVVVEDADGDTIVNLKVGARLMLDCRRDLYIGYGRSLTGDRWYRDIVRADLRFRY